MCGEKKKQKKDGHISYPAEHYEHYEHVLLVEAVQ